MANDKLNSSDQYDDLSLPDMEEGWKRMRAMLDKKDGGKKPLLPFSLRSCALLGLVLLILSVLTWFIAGQDQQPEKVAETSSNGERNSASNDKTKTRDKYENKSATADSSEFENNTVREESNKVNKPNETIKPQQDITNPSSTPDRSTVKSEQKVLKSSNNRNTTNHTKHKLIKRNQSLPVLLKSEKNKRFITNIDTADKKKSETKGKEIGGLAHVGIGVPDPDRYDSSVIQNDTPTELAGQIKSSLINSQPPALIKSDKAAVRIDTLEKPESSLSLKPNEEATSKKEKNQRFIFSAGLGMQQQIPIGNQQIVHYNYNGKKSTISDHIPSVYIRLENARKWFLQGEFRYGAAQSLNDFSYSRKTRLVDSAKILATTSYYLKKTYYHQVPISFNYYIHPKLSLGAGIIYHRFHGAVIEREIRRHDIVTQQETVAREILNIKHFNDTFFFKTQLQSLLQVNYQWKQFTLGLRYTGDIQPYIKYTEPDGEISTKKNQTFQALIQFRLWQSKR